MTTPFSYARSVLLTVLISAAWVGAAIGQVPTTIAFQGLMTDENGVPLPDGDYSITFRVYSVELAGAALWTEVQSSKVIDGIANANLGRINPLTLPFDSQYWLGITIGQNPTELKPRIQMSSVAYALNANSVVDGAISEDKLADGAVTADKLADGVVTGDKIADGAVVTAKIAVNGVEAANIKKAAVTPDKINIEGATTGQSLVINKGVLIWGAPSGEGVISEVAAAAGLEGGGTEGKVTLNISDEGVTTAMIRANAVKTDQIAKNAVTTNEIADDAVTSRKIPVGGVGLGRLSITGADANDIIVFNGTAPVWKAMTLADGSVVTKKLADGAVTGAKINSVGAGANEILTYDGAAVVWAAPGGIGPGSVGTTELADDAITTAKLADGAATGAKLADGAVTGAKINSVGAGANEILTYDGAAVVWAAPGGIGPGSVGTTELADDAVTTTKILDGAVTGAKIPSGAIDTPLLAASAVNANKLADAAVGLSKIDVSAGADAQVLTISGGAAVWAAGAGIGPGSVGETELADNSVSSAKIKTGAVTSGKIASLAVGDAALADGAVTNLKIAPATIDPLNKFDLSGASNGQFLVFNGGALTWSNTVPGNLNVTGDLAVTNNLSKGTGTFKIDHPLDPTNKYLYHSFVESDDMMNIYSGNAELDADGRAVVDLPDWFESVNTDFRYQLTCIGGYAPVYIENEIEDGEFIIAGGTPDLRVSWQITSVRNDSFARRNRMQVEVDKPAEERGTYLHPEPNQ